MKSLGLVRFHCKLKLSCYFFNWKKLVPHYMGLGRARAVLTLKYEPYFVLRTMEFLMASYRVNTWLWKLRAIVLLNIRDSLLDIGLTFQYPCPVMWITLGYRFTDAFTRTVSDQIHTEMSASKQMDLGMRREAMYWYDVVCFSVRGLYHRCGS